MEGNETLITGQLDPAPATQPQAAEPGIAPVQSAAQQPSPAVQKPEGAPEEYAAFDVPEDYKLDSGVGAQFKALAKELNLTQEQAQKMLNLDVQRRQTQAEGLAQMRTEWASQSVADSEFGGERLQENVAMAQKALETFGTPELKQLLLQTGLGDHPEVIRAFYRAGKAISEDHIVTGGAEVPAQAVTPQRLYGASNMNP